MQAPVTATTRVWHVCVALAVAAAIMLPVNFLMVPRNTACVTPDDCKSAARLNTVMIGSRSAINFFVVVIAIFVVLGLAGVDLKALAVSAGLLGLIIGLGAQSVIRSFIAGLVLLSSDRFSLGDMVQLHILGVGGASEMAPGAVASHSDAAATDTLGVVKDFSLLTTTIEDARGARTYVSNGNIMMVTNYSQNPQRAVVTMHVSHVHDPATIREPLDKFVDRMALDDELRNVLLRPPSVRGITSNDEHTYVVTVTALTTPTGVLATERHMRERLLHHFSASGIVASGTASSSAAASSAAYAEPH